jgi:MFS family permease
MGMGQPLGYSLGLILGGVFTDTIGWRYGYYISAIINAILFVGAIWGLPPVEQTGSFSWRRLAKDIDWTGALLISLSLGLLSYVLAYVINPRSTVDDIDSTNRMVTASYSRLRDAQNIALLCVAVVLIPSFVLWVARQERLQRPALIPNSLWKSPPFTSTCIAVFFTWAVFNAFQYFSTLL